MTAELVDEAVWVEVRRRRGPSTWVLVVAIALGVALVWAAFWARGTGRTAPKLTSNGMSAKYDSVGGTIDLLVRLGNTGAVPVTVIDARVLGPDGAASAMVTSVTVTPTVVPAGTMINDGPAGAVEVPIHLEVDCAAVGPNVTGEGPALVLTTTGTWPKHDWAGLGVDSMPGFCDPSVTNPDDGTSPVGG